MGDLYAAKNLISQKPVFRLDTRRKDPVLSGSPSTVILSKGK